MPKYITFNKGKPVSIDKKLPAFAEDDKETLCSGSKLATTAEHQREAWRGANSRSWFRISGKTDGFLAYNLQLFAF